MFNASNDPRFADLRAAYRNAAAAADRTEATATDHAAWLAARAAYHKAGGRDPANGWPVPANRKTMTKGEVDAKATMAFRRVTREEFHAALNADPRDIMPTIVSKNDPITGYTAEWRTQTVGRALFGKTDGYAVTSEFGRYWLYELEAAQ